MTQKGDIHTYEGIPDRYTIAGGAYFDWPWWRRRLSDIVERPYGYWGALRGIWGYYRRPRLNETYEGYIRLSFVVATMVSLYRSRVKPIWWAWKHGSPPESRSPEPGA